MGYRVMVQRQMRSDLPEDRVVNTLHFYDIDRPRPIATVADDVKAMLDRFFNTAAPGSTAPINSYLPMEAFHAAGSPGDRHKILVYNLEDAPPRLPEERLLDTTSLSAGTPYPFEVAMVASLETDLRAPRGRGRLYLGPLKSSVGTFDTATGILRVADAVRTNIAAQCLELAGEDLTPMKWAVYSPTDNVFRRVRSGWVDDAFDTQRRRGTEASTRNTWGPVDPLAIGSEFEQPVV